MQVTASPAKNRVVQDPCTNLAVSLVSAGLYCSREDESSRLLHNPVSPSPWRHTAHWQKNWLNFKYSIGALQPACHLWCDTWYGCLPSPSLGLQVELLWPVQKGEWKLEQGEQNLQPVSSNSSWRASASLAVVMRNEEALQPGRLAGRAGL